MVPEDMDDGEVLGGVGEVLEMGCYGVFVLYFVVDDIERSLGGLGLVLA
jgi:hypothetical protein